MGHMYSAQSFDGLDVVPTQAEPSKGGKVDMGDLTYRCLPVVAIYMGHELQRRSFLTPNSVMPLICRLTSSFHLP